MYSAIAIAKTLRLFIVLAKRNKETLIVFKGELKEQRAKTNIDLVKEI